MKHLAIWIVTNEIFFFNWALASVSLFDTIVLLWLGVTVLLNAEKRSWGIWLAGSGLLLGGIFFICHTATLDYNVEALINGIRSWWYLSWVSVILLPAGWYVLMLWYTGYWENRDPILRARHRPWLVVVLLLTVALFGLLARVTPHNFLHEVAHPEQASHYAVHGLPLLIMLYPLFLILCIMCSLDTLARPDSSGRIMGDVARQRARPWLIASTLVQLAVSLLVCDCLRRLFNGVRLMEMGAFENDELLDTIALFDFLITFLIGVAIVLLGKAIVSYEIFTGKILPRQGFLRQWRGIIAMAIAYSVIVCFAAVRDLGAVYLILLTTVLMSVFYAVLNWRSYSEREQYMLQLRPFVASQHLYEHLLMQSPTIEPDAYARPSFDGLCRDLLGASSGHLIALGPLAPLVGAPLSFPEELAVEWNAGRIAELFPSTRTLCASLAPDQWEGAAWAVPLWSKRGLGGALLLGKKTNGGIYTQEEMEIAQASGERILDALAGAALAQRLMALQRQRLAESQVLDRRARRTLHDDILPRIHTAIISLSAARTEPSSEYDAAVDQLGQAHREISNLLREMPGGAIPELARVGPIGALRHFIEKEMDGAFDSVDWNVGEEAAAAMKALPSLAAEVLFYAAREAIRNASRYGRPSGDRRPLKLSIVAACREGIELTIEDNGVGVQVGRASEGGSGQGLALHSTMMAVIGGALAMDSVAGQSTRILLSLPGHAMMGADR